MFEAKLRRKKALIPLVPRKPSLEVIRKNSRNKLRKRPSALVLQPSSSRPGTPTSQNSDTRPAPRKPNKLRKRSRSSTRSSPELTQQSLPVPAPARALPLSTQSQVVAMREKPPEVAFHRPIVRPNLGPPPSPSHGRRFEGMGVPRRRSPEKAMARPLLVGSPPGRGRPISRDRELV